MYELIVLGLIPGTQLQITFTLWFSLFLAGVGGYIILKAIRSQRLRHMLVAVYVAQTVWEVERLEAAETA